jgi:hypothetical protein
MAVEYKRLEAYIGNWKQLNTSEQRRQNIIHANTAKLATWGQFDAYYFINYCGRSWSKLLCLLIHITLCNAKFKHHCKLRSSFMHRFFAYGVQHERTAKNLRGQGARCVSPPGTFNVTLALGLRSAACR